MKLKGILLAALLFTTLPQSIRADLADQYVAKGRNFLSLSNLMAAHTNFAAALGWSPGHQTANVFYAATRLLVLPTQPAGSNFLSRVGVPFVGRDLYDWTAIPPSDSKRLPFAPYGVDANEFGTFARTNILPQLIGAEANLAKVVDTNFTLVLTGSETLGAAVTLDYGDIQLMRAMLQAAEFGCYTADSYNVDAQLSAIRWLYDNGEFSAERLLADYPQLLKFAPTNYLNAAKAAVQNGASRYFAASEWIRTIRSTNVVRLFNYSPEKAADEEKFRWTLADLTNSLAHPVTLRIDTNYSVYAGSPYSGTHEPRAFLPVIRGNDFGLGTLPDLTFGGLVHEAVPRVVGDKVEEWLSGGLFPAPTIAPGFSKTGPQFQLAINTLKGRGYTVEVSPDLTHWTNYTAFFSLTDGYSIVDPDAHSFAHRYYRVVDRTTDMPPPLNDAFANRIHLTGLGITAVGYISSASLEHNEPMVQASPHGLPTLGTVWWSWTAPVSGLMAVATTGSSANMSAFVYTGTALANLTNIAYPGEPFYAIAGTTYQIQVAGIAQQGGGINLIITAPPLLSVHSPADGTISLVPTNVEISASATDPDGSIGSLRFYVDGVAIGNTTNSSLSMTWSNVGVGIHNLLIEAADNLGVITYSNLVLTVRPPNDNFTNRIPIIAASAVVMGTNDSASTEPGEPAFGGNSVWWSWTATSSGYVTISADMVAAYYGHMAPLLAVYVGSSISNLTTVASDNRSPDFYGAPTQVSFIATAGIEYQIAVYGFASGGSGPPCCYVPSYSGGRITLRLVGTEPPWVNITSPLDGALISGGTKVVITADAFDNDGSISRVDFFDYAMKVGSVTNPPYTMVLSNLQSGTIHTLVAKATDNMGISTYSDSVSVMIETVLSPNVPVFPLSGAKDSTTYYVINVPTNTTRLEISAYGGTGDCDLYVGFRYPPSQYWWDYRPYLEGNNETVIINSPRAGDWHIMLNGWESYSDVSLEVDAW